ERDSELLPGRSRIVRGAEIRLHPLERIAGIERPADAEGVDTDPPRHRVARELVLLGELVEILRSEEIPEAGEQCVAAAGLPPGPRVPPDDPLPARERSPRVDL